METVSGGRTLGKYVLGLRVVRDDGGPIRFRQAMTRGLVSAAIEFPGLLAPPLTWLACLWTMTVSPQSKRLGDYAAGTVVIHERTPSVWGWMPPYAPGLAGWAGTLDLAGMDDELALAVRHYLSRQRQLREPARSQLGYRLRGRGGGGHQTTAAARHPGLGLPRRRARRTAPSGGAPAGRGARPRSRGVAGAGPASPADRAAAPATTPVTARPGLPGPAVPSGFRPAVPAGFRPAVPGNTWAAVPGGFPAVPPGAARTARPAGPAGAAGRTTTDEPVTAPESTRLARRDTTPPPGSASGARRVWRGFATLVAALVTLCAIVGVVRLVVPATAGTTDEPIGVRRQLAFLRERLDAGAGEEAQHLFPEGYFFLHVLYGLSWVELGQREPPGGRSAALREARWALSRLDSPAGREPFSADLTPRYGVFYQGWTNWLRGGILRLQPEDGRDPGELRRFAEDSAALGAAFDAASSPFLTAYPGQAWPVDSTVAVASLRLHDAVLPARYDGTVKRWLDGVRQRLDPRTGLLPHRVDPMTGYPVEVARATSQSVIQRFLVDVDADFAREQYLRFRREFVASPLGLGPAVREYPRGLDGPADVDSGPLPLGVSLSATVVTIGAAQAQRDAPLAAALANYGELAGVPVDTPSRKRYAFGLLPIGDAFLAWSKTARPWLTPEPAPPPAGISWWWRLPLLTLLALLGTMPWLPRLVRRRRTRSAAAGQIRAAGDDGRCPEAGTAR